jgi:hypothetical protein
MTTYTKEIIQEKIKSDDRWVVRSLEVLYDRQTRDEQETKSTNHNNGRGFNGTDSYILSSFTEQIKKKKDRGIREGFLSEKQLEISRKKLLKYWRQIQEEIENTNR